MRARATTRSPVPTNYSIRIVKTWRSCRRCFQHRLPLNREATSTVPRESENGRTCAPQAMASSCTGVARLGGALVAVVQAADLWNGDHTARRQRPDRTWKRCILVQAEVRSCYRVVGDALVQHAAKAGSRQHDQVIEALASGRSDESFDVGVLPGGARRRQNFLDADGTRTVSSVSPGSNTTRRNFSARSPEPTLRISNGGAVLHMIACLLLPPSLLQRARSYTTLDPSDAL